MLARIKPYLLMAGSFMSATAIAGPADPVAFDYVVHASRTINSSAAQIWAQLFEPAAWVADRRYTRIRGEAGKVGELVKVAPAATANDQHHFTQTVKLVAPQVYTWKAFSAAQGSYGLHFRGYEGLTLIEC